MSPRTIALIAALVVLPATGRAQDTSNDDASARLLKAARDRRAQAESTLGQNRRSRLSERAKLTRALQEAYARLADSERSAADAKERLQAAERLRLEGATARARARQRAMALSRLLGQAADWDAPAREEEEQDDPEAFLRGVESRVDARLRTLEHDTHIHIDEGPVLGRDGRARPARILRVGKATALAVAEDDGHTGFLRETPNPTGSDVPNDALNGVPKAPPIVVGPALSPAAISALRGAEPGKSGRIPFDVDGALTRIAAEAPSQSNGGIQAGGFFVWPILAAGLLGLLLFIERWWFFVLRAPRPNRIPEVMAALRRDDRSAASAIVSPTTTDLDRILHAGIDTLSEPRPQREQALETALLREEPTLERGVNLLGAVAGLAPLLGLLGTVTGMITTFDVISMFGTGNPRLLSGGISVALITTQLGLIVAVPALLAHAWVSRAVARRQALLEEARTALLSLDGPEEV